MRCDGMCEDGLEWGGVELRCDASPLQRRKCCRSLRLADAHFDARLGFEWDSHSALAVAPRQEHSTRLIAPFLSGGRVVCRRIATYEADPQLIAAHRRHSN